MPRLRRADCSKPGIRRRRAGKGWAYYGPDGSKIIDPAVKARLDALVLPPAWKDVWICPWPNGHIQALGTDAAGRRQYRYHEQWRIERDRAKHDRVLTFAQSLPEARDRVAADLSGTSMSRARALACAFRLLDLGFFRVGSEEYAEENGTYGLATMRREHVTVTGREVVFEYTAKSSKHRVQSIVDDDVLAVVQELLDRDDANPELLAFRTDDGAGEWCDVKSVDINDYVKQVTGCEVSAKDFRTWHATVLMAVALAVSSNAAASPSARKRAVSRGVTEVSTYLGNTPAVCRKSYIDPRVIDLFDDGVTVAPALERLGEEAVFGEPATHGQIEAAVLTLLTGQVDASQRRLRSSHTKAA
ncbi:DNA topoisomerase IB [Motilibacter peucedani]|uniref:DNA topoisomerase n=1 Tax=Motilibacter peucedani TaxID=598650 RepID=A0A420XNY9_9ACTN|nr:DNA topoisomerase IB [Motilibacter peucedani]RKS73923.1 DNA topoisomerase IB [Motilibacter peucedani]